MGGKNSKEKGNNCMTHEEYEAQKNARSEDKKEYCEEIEGQDYYFQPKANQVKQDPVDQNIDKAEQNEDLVQEYPEPNHKKTKKGMTKLDTKHRPSPINNPHYQPNIAPCRYEENSSPPNQDKAQKGMTKLDNRRGPEPELCEDPHYQPNIDPNMY